MAETFWSHGKTVVWLRKRFVRFNFQILMHLLLLSHEVWSNCCKHVFLYKISAGPFLVHNFISISLFGWTVWTHFLAKLSAKFLEIHYFYKKMASNMTIWRTSSSLTSGAVKNCWHNLPLLRYGLIFFRFLQKISLNNIFVVFRLTKSIFI